MVREYVESGLGCKARDARKSPAPWVLRGMPRTHGQEVVEDAKGLIGASNVRREGFKMDKTTLYHSPVNGPVGRSAGKARKEASQAGRKQKEQDENYADKDEEEKDTQDDSEKEKDIHEDSDKEEKEGQ